MAFQVIENPIRTVWVPLDTTSTPTLYNGQLVYSTGDGAGNLGQASGVGDTSGKKVPMGVVVGTNNRTPVFSTTSNSDSITAVITQAAQNARDYTGVEGAWSKGDQQAFVQVTLIGQNTILRAPIYNSTLGTAPTLLTVTTGSATGLGFTSNACDFTPVADLCTSYCRTGANAGLYRISDDTSTTVETNDVAFQNDIAIGDTFVRVPVRPFGQSYVQTDTNALFLDCTASPATNYWIIDVIRLDLREAGKEFVEFKFNSCHFDLVRA